MFEHFNRLLTDFDFDRQVIMFVSFRFAEKEALKTIFSKDAHPNNRERVDKLPAVVLNPCSPE